MIRKGEHVPVCVSQFNLAAAGIISSHPLHLALRLPLLYQHEKSHHSRYILCRRNKNATLRTRVLIKDLVEDSLYRRSCALHSYYESCTGANLGLQGTFSQETRDQTTRTSSVSSKRFQSNTRLGFLILQKLFK